MEIKVVKIKLLFILTFSLAYGQTYSSILKDSIILNFVNWEINKSGNFSGKKIEIFKKITKKISKYDATNFILPDSLQNSIWLHWYVFDKRYNIDTIFTQKEKSYIIEQFISLKDTNWHHHIKKSIIKNWKNPIGTYTYGIPLFTSDEKYVLIEKSYYCGNLCASGGIFLYKKVSKNNWTLLVVLNQWSS